MACEIITNIESFSDFLVYPTTCDYFFWIKILLAIGVVLVFGIYQSEKLRGAKPEIISAMGVSSLAILVLGIIGTLIKNNADIPMIQINVLLYLLAICIPLILLWIFKD